MTARIPSSTYRLQLNSSFTLAQATGILDYLHSLGIGDCYISPIVQSRHDSVHGYDVVDHGVVNPELGGEQAFRSFAAKAHALGIGILVDTVPNHMCIADSSNRWWFDVLENGPGSPYAAYFDIDWNPPKPELTNRVLLPVLGDQYGRVLENQEITVFYEEGEFRARYYQLNLPLAPQTWIAILEPALVELETKPGEFADQTAELASIITALRHLPPRTDTSPSKIRERQREREIIRQRLTVLIDSSPAVVFAINASLKDLNGLKGRPRSFDRLEQLLGDQAYRLSFWHVALDEINYRRFFDVNELAAIRVEQPEVFEAVHELTFRLLREGLITGLRVDHVDGLWEPGKYLQLLQARCAQAIAEIHHDDPAADARSHDNSWPFYVVIEKILGLNEPLCDHWPVYGTTGYEFINDLNGVFVDAANRAKLEAVYAGFSQYRRDFRDLVYDCKKLVLRASMSGEQNVLARKLDRISEQHRWSRDFTRNSLGRALAEVIACFPVYRSYIGSDRQVSDYDRQMIKRAIDIAKRRNPELSGSTFNFLESVLLMNDPEGLDETARTERLEFTMRFQQLTSAVMAKGFEDTALYRYYPLASLNEVGGDPTRFGVSADDFHAGNRRRLEQWPHALSATSTHDTKRGEDLRARINVLSEIPEAWEHAVRRWHDFNAPVRTELDGMSIPDRNEEYLLYQTLVGAWPLLPMNHLEHETFIQRVQDYMLKASKEAKLHTSWISPNKEHDQALLDFVGAVLRLDPANAFLEDFIAFRKPIAMAGMLNSLSQTLIKIGSPGIPDFYQGTELWTSNLVDPDNRRPIDFDARRLMLDEIRSGMHDSPAALLNKLAHQAPTGALKMYVICRALHFRREHPELFARGAYQPLDAAGDRSHHVISFARSMDKDHVIVAAGRFFISLGVGANSMPESRAWAATVLSVPPNAAAERYVELFTGRIIECKRNGDHRQLSMKDVFGTIPVAALIPIELAHCSNLNKAYARTSRMPRGS
ncbi:MAG: malto-oligosyltrehalose synthase [Candidatus Binataceae bacterium]|nr:malto-oligosyltrehalose synthase [Candidatus Binataceae bacterium]